MEMFYNIRKDETAMLLKLLLLLLHMMEEGRRRNLSYGEITPTIEG